MLYLTLVFVLLLLLLLLLEEEEDTVALGGPEAEAEGQAWHEG